MSLGECDDPQPYIVFLHNPRLITGLPWPTEAASQKLWVVRIGGWRALCQTWKVGHPLLTGG